jgi:hypothetical protein
MCQTTNTPGDEMHFHNFSPTAPHRNTLISHEFYLECCANEGEQPSAIFEVPGVTLDLLVVDAMHAADLGVFQEWCILGTMLASSTVCLVPNDKPFCRYATNTSHCDEAVGFIADFVVAPTWGGL